jgi:plastocyanin
VLRLGRRALLIAIPLVLLEQAAGLAATTNVSIVNFAFQPDPITVKLGDTVHWTNNATGGVRHGSTSDSTNPDATVGVAWWNSGAGGFVPGGTFDWIFTAAGKFTYHCPVHSTMHGTVNVAPRVAPATGTSGSQFRVRLATGPAPSGFVYDLQLMSPGAPTWTTKSGLTAPTLTLTLSRTGVWHFRARLRRTSNNGASEYSPSASATVT